MSNNRDNGNASAIREAIVIIRDMLINGGHDAQCRAKIVTICNTVLSTPPRNCDVGTAKEQALRKEAYCLRYSSLPTDNCDNCPLLGYNRASSEHMVGYSCDLAWAQLPYEAEGVDKC